MNGVGRNVSFVQEMITVYYTFYPIRCHWSVLKNQKENLIFFFTSLSKDLQQSTRIANRFYIGTANLFFGGVCVCVCVCVCV